MLLPLLILILLLRLPPLPPRLKPKLSILVETLLPRPATALILQRKRRKSQPRKRPYPQIDGQNEEK